MKQFEAIFRLSGKLDGSLMAAIKTAQNAMKGLKEAEKSSMSRQVTPLQNRLTELNRLNQMLMKYAQLRNEVSQGKVGSGQFSRLQDAARQLRAAGVSVEHLVQSMMRLSQETAKTADAMKRVSDTAKRLGEARAAHSRSISDLNDAWFNMSNAAETGKQILNPFVSAGQTAMTYEAELSRSKALTQMDHINRGNVHAIDREMAILDARYKEIGRTTQYSATEAARAGNYLAMAGFNAQQIDEGLASMVHLAIANNTELDRTADIFSNISTSMKIPNTAEGYKRLADRTTYLTTHSNQTLSMVDDTMKYVAPVASALEIDLEDLYAAQKFMVDSGVRGSMAGTAMKSFLLRSVAPSKKTMEAMSEAGFMTPEEMNQNAAFQELMEQEGIDASQTLQGESMLMSLIRQYSEKSKDWSKEKKTSFVEAWAGKYAAPGVMAMLENGGYDKIHDFYEGLRGSDGAAAQTAGVVADNTRGSWISLQSAIESASISIGNAFLPATRSGIDALTEVTRSIAQFASEHAGVVQAIGGIAASVAGGIVALGGFRLALAGLNFASTTIELIKATSAFNALTGVASAGGLTSSFSAMGAAISGAGRALMSFVFTPWGAAIAALSAAAYMIYSNWEQVGGYFETIGPRISAAFSEVTASVSPAIEQISAAWSQFMESFNASGLGQVMLAGVLGAVEVITNVITTAIKLVGDLLSTIGKIGGKLLEAFSLLMNGNILGAIGKVREALGEGLMGVFDMVKHAVEGFAQALQNIGKIAGGFYDGTIMKGEFDWSALSWGAKPSEPKRGESVRQTVLETVKSDRSEREEIEVELRNATREGNEEKTSELQTRLDNSEAITVASLTEALTELSAKEVKEAGGKDEFMSAVMSALREQGALNAEQQSSVISAVSEAIDSRLSTEGFTSELRAALSEKSTETLADRDALVQSMSQMISEQSNKDAALKAAIAEIKALDNVSDASKTDMIAQLTAAIEKLKLEEKKDDAPTKAMMPAAKSLESSSSALKSAADKLSALKSAAAKFQAAKEAQREGRLSTGETDPALAAAIVKAAQAVKRTDETAITRAMPMSMPSTVPTAPSGAAEITASTLELSAAISNAAAEQSAASSQVTASSLSATAAMTAFGSSSSAASMELVMFGSQATAAGTGVDLLGSSSSNATGGINGLASSASGAQAGVEALSGSAAGASGNVSGLGAAASSAISALMSAASSAGSAVMNAAGEARAALSSLFSGGEPAHNAVGGIYPRGEFLTTFAEDSAEAAIPIKRGDSNAISLWQRTGAMLGVLGGQQSSLPMSMPSMSNGYISEEMARKIGTFSNEVSKSKSYESMRRAQEKTSGSFLDRQMSTSMMKPLGPFGDIPLQMSMVSPSLSNGIISDEMARQGTYSDAVRKSKTYESLDRARRARTFSDEVVEASSKNPSMMKSGGLFGGLFAGISPMMSALPSNILSNNQSSESLSSKLQTYDQLEQQSMSLSTTTNNDQSMPPITLHFHFNGNVNREDVQRGVEESLPSIRETFEQQMMKYRHEVSRRSF